jgi:hypothetical protein
MTLSAGQVMTRLEELDKELQERQNEYEEAAENFYREKREWEKNLAQEFVKAGGKNQEERRSNALLALERDGDAYYRFVNAEARYEGQKAGFRVRETRASIGQSLLKSMAREAFPRAA